MLCGEITVDALGQKTVIIFSLLFVFIAAIKGKIGNYTFYCIYALLIHRHIHVIEVLTFVVVIIKTYK